jgi:queuine tRNA-ribosyltransferase
MAGPILTDSGGFQVFSLSDINRISDDGVVFKSHVDGSMVQLTPARSMEIQNDLGADIIMAFDECPDPNKPREYQVEAVERTLRWARLCIEAHARPDDQSLFGIVQGGVDEGLRQQCARELVAMNFPATRSAGWRWARGSTRCCACWITRRRCCRPISRGT